jgi:succinoglycan biosynthesis transport protein ExoP
MQKAKIDKLSMAPPRLDSTNTKRPIFPVVEERPVALEPWREGIGLSVFLAKVRRQKRMIRRLVLVGVVVGSVAGLVYNLLRVPTFAASSELLISNTTLQMSGPDAAVTQVLVENSLVQSAIEMIKSTKVLERVIDRMGLENIELILPKSILERLGLQSTQPADPSNNATIRQRAVALLRSNTTATRVGASLIVSVRGKALTAQDAARLANELAGAFVQEQNETSAVVTTSAALRERIKVLGPTARIISEAIPPSSKDGPRGSLALVLAVLFGGALGAGAGLTFTLFDRRVRSAEQLVALTSLECFGYVPQKELKQSSRVWRGGPLSLPSVLGISVLRRARSAVLERSTRVPHIFGVTSCCGGEGRTTLAANWARFIARDGSRVLFVDATLHISGETQGLHELLRGEVALGKVVQPDISPNVDLLPRGKALSNLDMLWGNLIQAIGAEHECPYEWVILDLPPLLTTPDVRSTGLILDDLLVVVEWGRTSESQIQRGLRLLGPVRGKVIGTLINKTPLSSLDSEMLVEALATRGSAGPSI